MQHPRIERRQESRRLIRTKSPPGSSQVRGYDIGPRGRESDRPRLQQRVQPPHRTRTPHVRFSLQLPGLPEHPIPPTVAQNRPDILTGSHVPSLPQHFLRALHHTVGTTRRNPRSTPPGQFVLRAWEKPSRRGTAENILSIWIRWKR